VPLVDSSFLGPARAIDYLKLTDWFAVNGFPMQHDGLTSSSTPQNSDREKSPIVAEQRGATSSSGDTLAADCAAGTGPLKSRVLRIYQADIEDSANQSALKACATSVMS
jgi:hypothetical protein